MTTDQAVALPSDGRTENDWDAGRSSGRLIVAWQHPESRMIAPVGVLEHGPVYTFRYLRRALEVEGFRPFLSFPQWERIYYSDALFPLFAQRIMSPRRPDFRHFLRQLDLGDDATPWEQLARSEGRSSGDTVQVFPVPAVRADGRSTSRFLVHGVRHNHGGRLPPLEPGDRLILQDEPTNPKNPAAVQVTTTAGRVLGHVPDLLLDHLAAIRATAVAPTLAVEHVNGPEAPPHFRLLVRLDGFVGRGYIPMTGSGWATFAD